MTVIYASFVTERPVGGPRVAARHVELLRELGHDAVRWLPTEPEGPDDVGPWVAGATLEVGEDDVLVYGEFPLAPDTDPAPGARVVVFNQNPFLSFACGDPGGGRYPDWGRAPAGIWTVSASSAAVLTRLGADPQPRVIPNPVDLEAFRPVVGKEPGIAWMPRKRPFEARLVRQLLLARAGDVALHEIDGLSPEETADVLGRSTVFLALGHAEGFGLPVAEAMAAGCVVVGYDGGGGADLFEAPDAHRVPDHRPVELVDRALDLVAATPASGSAANRAFVREHHDAARTREALDEALAAAREAPGAAATARHPAAFFGRMVADPRFAG